MSQFESRVQSLDNAAFVVEDVTHLVRLRELCNCKSLVTRKVLFDMTNVSQS